MMNRIAILYLLLFICQNAFAQNIESQINKDSIEIGEPITLTVKIPYQSKEQIQKIEINDSILIGIEVISENYDTIQKSNEILYQVKFTHFDSGDYLVKPIRFQIGEQQYRSQSHRIHVKEVYVDESKDKIYPIKPILEEKFTLLDYWNKYWIYVLMISAILLIFMIALFLFLSRKSKNKTIPQTPIEEALFRLKELDKKSYLSKNQLKPFYSDLVWILKSYFARRYHFNALKFLSSELVDFIQKPDELSTEDYNKIREFFTDADGVKYAKAIPEEFKHQEYRKLIERWIIKTREITEEEALFNQRKETP